ncbi:MAG: cysteine peptidase family C39 domain-containing protein [Treponema sp.]|nr:cysteine peptidase family C39 domain-containing protein [Treponema sp.]
MPLEETRFEHTYKQSYDTSCGIEAMATLLGKFWGLDVTAREVFLDMTAELPEDAQGFATNFADMAGYMGTHGIAARGFRMGWEELEQALAGGFGPIVVHYDRPVGHFALLLHIEGDFAFLSDPSTGAVIVDRASFLRRFSGNVLLAASATRTVDREFLNTAVDRQNLMLSRLRRVAGNRI